MEDIQDSPKNIDDYIARFSPEVQKILKQIRTIIRETAPGAEETIKYRMPTFVLNENLVHFAAYQNHVGFYPTPSGIEKFKDDLSTYKHAKGSVQFPISKPMPLKLIRKMVAFRVKEIHAKQFAKKKT